MPVVRKLDEGEVRAITQKTLGVRKATEAEYDRHLAGFHIGDYGEVDLDEGENRLTVRNRLRAAADRHVPPLALVFHRTRGSVIRFQIADPANVVASPRRTPVAAVVPAPVSAPETSDAPATPKRGRKAAGASAAAPAPAPARTRRRRKTE